MGSLAEPETGFLIQGIYRGDDELRKSLEGREGRRIGKEEDISKAGFGGDVELSLTPW